MPCRLNSGARDFAERFAELLNAREGQETSVANVVTPILADVRARGDAALIEYTQRFDRHDAAPLRVPAEAIANAMKRVHGAA